MPRFIRAPSEKERRTSLGTTKEETATNGPSWNQAAWRPLLEKLEPRVLLDAVKITPWVAGVTTNSVYACLEADSTATATADYGLTTSYGLTATTENTQATSGGNCVHNIKLTELQPNTQYHYRVRQGASTTADYSFWTAPAADYTGTVRWGFAADPHIQPAVHNAIAALVAGYSPQMMVYGGDLAAKTQVPATYAEWNNEWFVSNQNALNATVPWVNSTGNHEQWSALTQAFTHEPSGVDDPYFSFNYGSAHFLILNFMVAYSPGSAQWNFAAADMSSPATQAMPWKIVVCHRAAYVNSSDIWGGTETGDTNLQAMTTQIFEPAGVDFFLAGHDHIYQHNVVNGIQHMVISPSGAPTDIPVGGAPYTVYSEQTECFAMFDMTPTQLTLRTYRYPANTLIETITLTHDATPPTAPTGLTATGLSISQIRLNWTAASDPESGIDHYNIYRDGSLMTTAPGNQTTFTDSGLTEATGYSYQVSAVNPFYVEGARAGPVVGTTLAETTPPALVSAGWQWEDHMSVRFSEPVEAASAENPANYAVTCPDQYVRVLSATLDSDNVTVRLRTTDLAADKAYSLVVNNVRDRAHTPNAILPNSSMTPTYQGWFGQDIGTPGAPGSDTYAAGTYTVQADGSGLTGTSDGFYYLYRTLSVGGELVCRIASMPQTAGAKAGVMIRSSLAPDSIYVAVLLDGGAQCSRMQNRDTTGGGTSGTVGTYSTTAPYYLRLVRTSLGLIRVYQSAAQGGPWTMIEPAIWQDELSIGTVYIGIVATNAATSTGTFVADNLQYTEYSTPPTAAPVGVADSYPVAKNEVWTVPYTAGILVNDTDADDNSLSASVQTPVSHGVLSLLGNGAFTYTPTPGWTGQDSFVYTVSDGHGGSATATVALKVLLPGDANADDLVDTQDFTILKAGFGQSGRAWGDGDFNNDGLVDSQDFTLLKAYFGQHTAAAAATEEQASEPTPAVLAASSAGVAGTSGPSGVLAAGPSSSGQAVPYEPLALEIDATYAGLVSPSTANKPVEFSTTSPAPVSSDAQGDTGPALEDVLVNVLGDLQPMLVRPL